MSAPAKAAEPRTAVPQPEDFSRWMKLNARNRDTDQYGHVNHAAMATFFEEGRIDLIFSPELATETAGVDLLVARLTMTFHKELRAPGEVRLGAKVNRIGTSSLDIRQGIFQGETCFASAEAVCVLFGAETRRPVPISEKMRAHLLASG